MQSSLYRQVLFLFHLLAELKELGEEQEGKEENEQKKIWERFISTRDRILRIIDKTIPIIN